MEKESGWIWNGATGKFDLILVSETGKVRIVELEAKYPDQPKD